MSGFIPAVAVEVMVKRTVIALVGVEKTMGGIVWSIICLGRRLSMASTACFVLGAILGGQQDDKTGTMTRQGACRDTRGGKRSDNFRFSPRARYACFLAVHGQRRRQKTETSQVNQSLKRAATSGRVEAESENSRIFC